MRTRKPEDQITGEPGGKKAGYLEREKASRAENQKSGRPELFVIYIIKNLIGQLIIMDNNPIKCMSILT